MSAILPNDAVLRRSTVCSHSTSKCHQYRAKVSTRILPSTRRRFIFSGYFRDRFPHCRPSHTIPLRSSCDSCDSTTAFLKILLPLLDVLRTTCSTTRPTYFISDVGGVFAKSQPPPRPPMKLYPANPLSVFRLDSQLPFWRSVYYYFTATSDDDVDCDRRLRLPTARGRHRFPVGGQTVTK